LTHLIFFLGKENPFGEAKPVDSQESVEINSEKAVSFSPEKSFTRGGIIVTQFIKY
jgi:hypothetical protein